MGIFISIVIVFAAIQTSYSNESSNKANWSNDNPSNAQLTKNLASMPLSFTVNQGQWDDKVQFKANAGRATMWFASDGVYYQFTRTFELKYSAIRNIQTLNDIEGQHNQPESAETMLIKASFVGANPNPKMVGVDMMEYKCNYFIGNDESKWATDVPNYSAVMYEQIYEGIDLKYYGNGKQMEYDFIVSPGADFSQIRIRYEGAESISINENGELVVATIWGEVVEKPPVIYQVENNNRISIEGTYLLQDENSFSFELSAYNPALSLVIDPILVYSTYLGGIAQDNCIGFTVDGSGNAYITGWTISNDFPVTPGAFQTNLHGTYFDAFVTKMNASGDSLVYSTYLGGSNTEAGWDIELDDSGNAYLTGESRSTDFPITAGAVQPTLNGANYDAIVTILNSAGNALIYSTFLGGSDVEVGYSIALDSSGNIYITGKTESTDFPATVGAYQTTFQGGGFYVQTDAFAAKLNSSGDTLIYSTYLGGSNNESGWDIEADNSGNAYITGFTLSANFPMTVGAYQTTLNGNSDAYVTKLNPLGTALLYSTYIGGDDSETGYGIALDGSDNAYITGLTGSTDYPTTPGAFQETSQGSNDAFVAKFNPSGNELIYSTYLGGSNSESGRSIALDGSGNAYIVGTTASADFPITADAYQTSIEGGPYDAYVSKLNSSGSDLDYSTFIGGSESEHISGIALDGFDNAYIGGYTSSPDFPTTEGAYQPTYQGTNGDAIVFKIGGFATDIKENDVGNLPLDFKMSQNYPNPFNAQTTIQYSLAEPSEVTIEIYDLLGRKVETFLDQEQQAGQHQVVWDASKHSSGVYFYRIEAGDIVETKRMVLLK